MSEGIDSQLGCRWRRSHEGRQCILPDSLDRSIPEVLGEIERWQYKLGADVAMLRSVVENGFETMLTALSRADDSKHVATEAILRQSTLTAKTRTRQSALNAKTYTIKSTNSIAAVPTRTSIVRREISKAVPRSSEIVPLETDVNRNTPCGPTITSTASGTSNANFDQVCTITRVIPDAWPATVDSRFENRDGTCTEVDQNRDSICMEIGQNILNSKRGRTFVELVSKRDRRTTIIRMSLLRIATRHFVFNQTYDPHCKLVLYTDVAGIIVLMHDMFVTPVVVSWPLTLSGTLLGTAWLAAVYWLVSMVLCFKTRIFQGGELINSQRSVAIAYCKGWLLTDLLLLCVDWIYVTANSDIRSRINSISFVKMVRILLRFFRFVRVMVKVYKDTLPLLRITGLPHQIICVGVTVFVVNHIMASVWFFMGSNSSGAGSFRWVDLNTDPTNELTFRQASIVTQYIAALHFVVAHITLGSSGVDATNAGESVFCIVLLGLGFLGGSIIVSMCSGEVVQLMLSKRDQVSMATSLRIFLQQNLIKSNLVARVMHQAFHDTKEEMTLSEVDVPALRLLSVTLRRDLIRSIRVPHLLSLPLFNLWAEIDMSAINRMCDEVVGFVSLKSEDALFDAGSDGYQAYCLMRGTISYWQYSHEVFVKDDVMISLTEGNWLCEMSLWSSWIHVGRALATTNCQVLFIRNEAFSAFVNKTPSVHKLTLEYAFNYHIRIVSAIPPHVDYPTDIKVPFTEVGDLMPKSVSIALLHRAIRHRRVDLDDTQRCCLLEELERGTCVLRHCADGTFERTVSVVAVRVLLANQWSFMQIAKIVLGGKVSCGIQLPGTKRARGELPRKAFERVMIGVLYGFDRGVMEFQRAEHSVDRKVSPQFGMLTEYMRTVHEARIEESGLPDTLQILRPNASSDPPNPPVSSLMPRTVYAIAKQSICQLYAFLTETEVATLTSQEARPALEAWINSFDLSTLVCAATKVNRQPTQFIV